MMEEEEAPPSSTSSSPSKPSSTGRFAVSKSKKDKSDRTLLINEHEEDEELDTYNGDINLESRNGYHDQPAPHPGKNH